MFQRVKMNKYEKMELKNKKVEMALKGEGLYLYENNTKGTLLLPKAMANGSRELGPVDPKRAGSGRFQGDSYFMHLVKTNELKLIQEIMPPQVLQPKEEVMNEKKLILDQPERVTSEGVVETVMVSKKNEKMKKESKHESKEILLNEGPIDGIEILGE